MSVELYTCVLLNWSKGACQILFGGFCKLGGGGTPQIPQKLFVKNIVRKWGEGNTPQVRLKDVRQQTGIFGSKTPYTPFIL